MMGGLHTMGNYLDLPVRERAVRLSRRELRAETVVRAALDRIDDGHTADSLPPRMASLGHRIPTGHGAPPSTSKTRSRFGISFGSTSPVIGTTCRGNKALSNACLART